MKLRLYLNQIDVEVVSIRLDATYLGVMQLSAERLREHNMNLLNQIKKAPADWPELTMQVLDASIGSIAEPLPDYKVVVQLEGMSYNPTMDFAMLGVAFFSSLEPGKSVDELLHVVSRHADWENANDYQY